MEKEDEEMMVMMLLMIFGEMALFALTLPPPHALIAAARLFDVSRFFL